MKALSIDLDYVYDIMDGVKTEEYRSWATKHRGDLLICVTARSNATRKGFGSLVVDITDCKLLPDGGYAWQISNVRFIRPFEVRGQQHLYEVDDALIVFDSHDPDDSDYWDKIYDDYLDSYGVPA